MTQLQSDETVSKRPVLIIDAMNVYIRNFCVSPLMAEGQQVGGIIGFLRSLNLLIETHRPKECVIVWEGGGSSRRRSIYPDYKGGRKPQKLNRFHDGDIPDSVDNKNWQVEALIAALKNLPIRQLYISDCEADDVIGYLSKYSYKDSRVVIVSSDHDYLQLVDNRINVWSPTLKSIVTEESVKERFGVLPHNLLVVRCFCGDASDNLQGVKGLGFKTMIKRFPDLASEKCVELEDIIDYASSMPEKSSNVYAQVKTNANLGRMNWKLMKLDVSNLSWNQVSKLNSALETQIPSCNKLSLSRTLLKCGIKTIDVDKLCLNSSINLKTVKSV